MSNLNASTLASKERRKAARAIGRMEDELSTLEQEGLVLAQALRDVEQQQKSVAEDLERLGRELEEEDEVVVVGERMLEDVEIKAVLGLLKEELRQAIFDDIKTHIAMPICQEYAEILHGNVVAYDDVEDRSYDHEYQSRRDPSIAEILRGLDTHIDAAGPQQGYPDRGPVSFDEQAWLRTLPPNLSAEDFGRLMNEQQQQQSQRLTSSSGDLDPRMASVVGYGGSQSRTENPRIPSTVLDLPLTGVLVPTAVSTSGGHKSLAAELTAGYDFDKEVDQVLKEEGWKPVAEMHNGMIEERYRRCSREHHQLLLYLDPRIRSEFADYVKKAQQFPSRGDDDCKPCVSLNKSVMARCPHCDVMIREDTVVNRIIALHHEPTQNYWKAVIRKRGGGIRDYVFHGSAMCAVFQGTKHCVRVDHVRFETYRHNGVRQGNHSGRYGCWCPIPCVGENVKHRVLTKYEVDNGQYRGVVPLPKLL